MVNDFDLSSVKAVICGAAPFGEELEAEVEKRLKVPVCGGYGMTEVRTWDFRSASSS